MWHCATRIKQQCIEILTPSDFVVPILVKYLPDPVPGHAFVYANVLGHDLHPLLHAQRLHAVGWGNLGAIVVVFVLSQKRPFLLCRNLHVFLPEIELDIHPSRPPRALLQGHLDGPEDGLLAELLAKVGLVWNNNAVLLESAHTGARKSDPKAVGSLEIDAESCPVAAVSDRAFTRTREDCSGREHGARRVRDAPKAADQPG